MRKSFQFRIYPTKNQEVTLNRTLSTCRHLYNDSLAKRKRQAELNELERTFWVTPWGKPQWLNYYDQANSLSGSKTDISLMASAIPGFREGIDIIVSHIHNPALDLKTGNSTYRKSELSESYYIERSKERSRPVRSRRILTNGMLLFHVKSTYP